MKTITGHRTMTILKLILLLACGFFIELSTPSETVRRILKSNISETRLHDFSSRKQYQFINVLHETNLKLARFGMDKNYSTE